MIRVGVNHLSYGRQVLDRRRDSERPLFVASLGSFESVPL